jgi:hypothetical protein
MAAIVREMEPELPADDSKKGVTFVVFAPQIKQEKHYDVIEAPEAE